MLRSTHQLIQYPRIGVLIFNATLLYLELFATPTWQVDTRKGAIRYERADVLWSGKPALAGCVIRQVSNNHTGTSCKLTVLV